MSQLELVSTTGMCRYAMKAGHPCLYPVYEYMEGGDLGRALTVPPGSHGALTQGERIKVSVRVRVHLCIVLVKGFLL